MKNKTNTIETILSQYKLKFNEVLHRMYSLEILPSIQARVSERIPERGGFTLYKNEELEAFLSQALKTVQEETREEILQFIWDHRTAEDGDTIFVKFKMKNFKKFKEDK